MTRSHNEHENNVLFNSSLITIIEINGYNPGNNFWFLERFHDGYVGSLVVEMEILYVSLQGSLQDVTTVDTRKKIIIQE